MCSLFHSPIHKKQGITWSWSVSVTTRISLPLSGCKKNRPPILLYDLHLKKEIKPNLDSTETWENEHQKCAAALRRQTWSGMMPDRTQRGWSHSSVSPDPPVREDEALRWPVGDLHVKQACQSSGVCAGCPGWHTTRLTHTTRHTHFTCRHVEGNIWCSGSQLLRKILCWIDNFWIC